MKSTCKHKHINAASILLLASLPGYCSAEIVSVDITAIVEYVDDYKNYLGGKIKPGDQITGTYVYDTVVADNNSLTSVGDYWHYQPGFGVCLDVAGMKFGSSPDQPSLLMEMVNDLHNRDNYLLRSYNNLFAVAVPSNPDYPQPTDNHIAWQLDDSTQQALTNTNLNNQPPHLNAWQSMSGLTIDSRSGGEQFMIRAHVTGAVRGTSTSIGNCVSDPVAALPSKYIDSTLLHRSANITDKTEAVLYNDEGIYTITTRNLSNGALVKGIRLPEVAGAKPIGLVGIKDTNANSYPDIALLYVNNEGKSAHIRIIDSYTEAKLKVIDGSESLSTAKSLELIPDLNRNGFEEIATLYETPTASGLVVTLDSKTGMIISKRPY